MSVLLPPGQIARLCGFGMASCADGYVFRPKSVAEVVEVFEVARGSGRKVVLRGAGRSYGDASILPEQVVLDITAMNQIVDWDPGTGIIDVEAGFTIEDLWRTGLPDGWWPPVVSGTMFPTLAGALAMNIHGKNNFAAGTVGEHVLELEVVTPRGETLRILPDNPLMRAFISSAGLLGVITRVKLQLKNVGTGMLRVKALAQKNWDEQFETFDQTLETENPDYFVSWIDGFARGGSAGRGLIHAAWYDPAAPAPESYDLPPKIAGVVPKAQVWRVLQRLNNRAGMKAVNVLKSFSAARREHNTEIRQSLVAFSFLLDYVPDWRKAYLPGGFIQYQSFLPRNRAKGIFAEQIRLAQAAGLEPFLAVMKRHRADDFMFSHGVDGYSLALDFKIPREPEDLWDLCHRLNDLVLGAEGRFYFAKDSTLRPSDVAAYLGEEVLDGYRRLKARFDPENLLRSSLANRVGL